jgi:hypothetical protein
MGEPMSHDLVTPRLVYRGTTDATAETLTVADASALTAALKAGYRLSRVTRAQAAPAPPVAVPPVAVPTPAAAPVDAPKAPAARKGKS